MVFSFKEHFCTFFLSDFGHFTRLGKMDAIDREKKEISIIRNNSEIQVNIDEIFNIKDLSDFLNENLIFNFCKTGSRLFLILLGTFDTELGMGP